MISFFRNFFQSKIGLPIFIGFLVLVALAFAAADITGSTFGGVSGNDQIAVIGEDRISSGELSSTTNFALRDQLEDNPTLSMPEFIEEGGMEEVLRQMIDRFAVAGYGEKFGLRGGENLVNSEILKITAFRDPTGEFDQTIYENALRAQNLTDAQLRRDISDGVLVQQILTPALASSSLPLSAAKQYSALLLERRRGEIAFIPSFAFAPEGDPTDEQLETYYSENNSRFIRPERRTIRYALFGSDSLDVDLKPTPAEIQEFYESNSDRFAASETRNVSSFLVSSKDAAEQLVTRIRGGLSLEAAARESGFSVSSVESRTQEDLAASLSAQAAESIFAAERGQIADTAQSNLGWIIARVDAISRTPAQSLTQATPEITQQLTAMKRASALSDLSARVEEEVDSGTSLLQVADSYGLTVNTTPPVLADGRVFGGQGQSLNQALRQTVETAFQMDESEPQLAEIVPGQQFVVFDVEQISEAAAPPLADIREQVTIGWRLAEGNKQAKQVADRVLEKVRADATVTSAVGDEDTDLPPIERIDLERRQLLAQREQAPPPPLILMFSMAAGSSKLYEAPNNIGWYVVQLDEIVTEDVPEDSPILQQTQEQLAAALAAEYSQQLTAAIREGIGVERNEEAIEALRRQLSGRGET